MLKKKLTGSGGRLATITSIVVHRLRRGPASLASCAQLEFPIVFTFLDSVCVQPKNSRGVRPNREKSGKPKLSGVIMVERRQLKHGVWTNNEKSVCAAAVRTHLARPLPRRAPRGLPAYRPLVLFLSEYATN